MALSLRAVRRSYGDFILGPIDLEVGREERVAVVGPSGSGKSTVLRIVAGLVMPDEGRVYRDGRDVTTLEPWRREVGLVFQSPALSPPSPCWKTWRSRSFPAAHLGRRLCRERARFWKSWGLGT